MSVQYPCLYIIIIPGLFIKKQKQNKTQTTQKISNIEIVDICQFCVHVFALPFYTHYVGDYLMHILYQSCLILFFDKFLRWFSFHIHFTHILFPHIINFQSLINVKSIFWFVLVFPILVFFQYGTICYWCNKITNGGVCCYNIG